ncbi:MAG: Mg2+ and Co2+ transporter CorB [Acetivibrionales bacterium]
MEDNCKPPASERRVKFKKNLLGSKDQNRTWIIIITLISFTLSVTLMFVSSEILEKANNFIALWVVFIIILIGILFDMIGIAVTAADETPFHAMAARKLYGAKQAIQLIRNANKVSSFCNDVVGDICGIISGTASALILVRVSDGLSATHTVILSLVISGLVASITVGGKAMGKTFAIRNSNYIVYRVSVIVKFFVGKISLKEKRTDK